MLAVHTDGLGKPEGLVGLKMGRRGMLTLLGKGGIQEISVRVPQDPLYHRIDFGGKTENL